MKKFIFFLIIFFSFNAHAKFTVQNLKNSCEGADANHPWFACLGYINGTVAGLNLGLAIANSSPAVCIDEPKMTTGQMIDIFLAWARQHPKYYQWDASQGIAMAFMEAYPCKPKSKSE